MLTDERKDAVRRLGDEELEIEVARGSTSRFQGELFDYAKAQLALRAKAKQDESQRELMNLNREGLNVSKRTMWATRMAWVMAAVAVIAALLAQRYLKSN